jgi:hypothetical protein
MPSARTPPEVVIEIDGVRSWESDIVKIEVNIVEDFLFKALKKCRYFLFVKDVLQGKQPSRLNIIARRTISAPLSIFVLVHNIDCLHCHLHRHLSVCCGE